MSAISDYFQENGTGTDTSQRTSPINAYFKNAPSTLPASKPVAAPVTPPTTPPVASGSLPPSATVGKLGGGYTSSNIPDTAGRPLLAYFNNQAQSSQLLSDRVASTFNPTVAQKVDPATLQDPRMASSISQAIRQAVGATAFQELDHIMPLELGGSNEKTNLRLESGKNSGSTYNPSSNPTATDPLENQLAQKVHNGDTTGYSLVDAWRDMAKAKGITLPEDGGTVPHFGQSTIQQTNQPSSLGNKIINGVKAVGSTILGAVNSFFENAQKTQEMDTHLALAPITPLSNTPLKTYIPGVKEPIVTTNSVATQALGGIIQTPERTFNDIKDLVGVLSGKANQTVSNAQNERVPSYIADMTATYQAGKDAGLSDGKATIAAMLQGFGAGTLDITTAGDMLSGISNKVVKATAEDLDAIAAWQTLGKPSTIEEAAANYKSLAHEFHPDKIGGSNEAMGQINTAYDTLKAKGVPSNVKVTLNNIFSKFSEPLGKASDAIDRTLQKEVPTLTDGETTQSITPKETTPLRQEPALRPTTAPDAAMRYEQNVIAPAREEGKMIQISADDMKDYFGKDYNDANHPIYSKAAFDLYKDELAKNANPQVILTGGGPASGKTEFLTKQFEKKGFDGIVYDSNMANYNGVVKQIELAKQAGKEVQIYGITPDLESARRFSIVRENHIGRGISDKTFAHGHAGFPEVVKQLLDNGVIKPEQVHIVDTRGITSAQDVTNLVQKGHFVQDPLAHMNSLGYNEEDLKNLYAKDNFNPRNGIRIKNAGSPKRSLPASRKVRPNSGTTNHEPNGVSRVLHEGISKEKGGVSKKLGMLDEHPTYTPHMKALIKEAQDTGGMFPFEKMTREEQDIIDKAFRDMLDKIPQAPAKKLDTSDIAKLKPTGKKFYIFNRHKYQFVETKGEAVSIPGVDAFVHGKGDMWAVSESKGGHQLGGGNTKEAAIANAKHNVAVAKKDGVNIAELIDQKIKAGPGKPSPRYQAEKTFAENKSSIPKDPLAEEARKYKSAEEFVKNNDLVFQGGPKGAKSGYWSTKIGEANAYATQASMKEPGEIRVARFSDIEPQYRGDPTQEEWNGKALSKSEYTKSTHVITVGKDNQPPMIGTIKPDSTGLAGDKLLIDFYNKATKGEFQKGDIVKVIGKHPTLREGDIATVRGTIVDKYGNVEVRVSTGKNATGQEIKNTISADLLKKVDVPEAKAPTKQVELGSGLNPNLDKFIEEDLKPATKGVVQGVKKSIDLMQKMVSPVSRGPEAQLTASIMRESLGKMARDKEIVFESLSKSKKIFDSYSKEESLALIDGIETGNPVKGSEGFTKIVRDALDERWAKIQAIKGSEAYIENYFPHIWEDPEKAKGVLSQFFGKRPLEGTKSYLKERKIPTIKQGVELGLVPTSYNPVELVMARISDMDRFIMANDIWTQFKEQGLRKFVKAGEKPPKDWIMVDDKISRALQFSEAEKAMIIRGNWYLPEKSATIINNYLSPGLAGNPIYNGLRMVSNQLNQVQLGMSGFHALFTSGDAVISKAALSIQKIFIEPTIVGKGKALVTAGTSPITAPYLLFKNIIRGNKLLVDYFKANPQIPDMVDALERAGGRVRMDSFYLNNSVDNFLKALRGGNYLGATFRAPGAMIETMGKPIMQWLVPRQKLGIFADMADTILKQSSAEQWTEQLTTLRLQQAWDSVDNRMGQLVYDNVFWNKALKDVGMAATRSLGWNLGTFRELGGGLIDFPIEAAKGIGKVTGFNKGEGPRMTPKMAYTIALPFVVGVWGAMLYYLYHGKAPETLLDYYYVPTGKIKPDGTPERIALPSYMKDVFAYKAEGLQTVANKLNPQISAIVDMLENKDYYGTEIRNPNDPWVKQLRDAFSYEAQQFVPFTITNLLNRQKAGDTSWASYLQSFSGITPAPGYITRTPLQTEIYNLYDKRFPSGQQTQQQAADAQLKSQIRTAYMTGDDKTANTLLKQAVQQGIIKPTGVATFIRDADIPTDVKLFQQLPASDQEQLLKNMELVQLERYVWSANGTVKAHLSTLSGNGKAFVDLEKQGSIKAPEWKRGQIVTPAQ